MEQKGISTIVATILMLIITIALVGSAGMFIFGLFTGRVATAFSIIDVYYGNVTIRNEGTANISSMTAIVDGQPVNVLFLDGPIPPGSKGTVTLQYFPTTSQRQTLRLSTPTMSTTWYLEHPEVNVLEVYPCHPILAPIATRSASGLVAMYQLDEGSGTIARDSSGNINTGSLHNFGWTTSSGWVDGKIGRALSFDGVNDYVSVPHSGILNEVFGTSTVFTLSAWAYPRAWANWATIMNKATCGYWSCTTNGMWASDQNGFACAMGSNVAGNPPGSIIMVSYKPPLNNWYHIVCTADGTKLRMFVNGNEVGSVSIAGLTHPRSSNTAPLVFGQRCVDCGPSFNGIIDEVRIYNRALTAEEIKALYLGGIFRVVSIPMDTFNAGYDFSGFKVIAFGFADCYNWKHISSTMAAKVEDFVRKGGGLLVSHDTSCCLSSFNAFNDELGIDCSGSSGDAANPTRRQEGYITQIPYGLPNPFSTQWTHTTCGQRPITATIWYWKGNNPDRFYLITNRIQNGKTAFIQYGHATYWCDCSKAFGIPPADEQKAIVNTLWWLAIPN